MRLFTAWVCVFFALPFVASQPAAQDRSGDRLLLDIADPAQSAPMSSPISPSSAANIGAGSSSVPVSAGSQGYYGGGSSYAAAATNLSRTSFGTFSAYYSWTNYYSFLSRTYHMDPSYFSRFYRNTEPLITPEILKLTLRGSMRLSSEMLDSIDELEAMLRDAQSGKKIDKPALREKSKSIRALAKKIRSNQTLAHIDLRKERDLCKEDRKGDTPDLEALNKMRAMAVDIDRQLRNLYSQPTTATVSVEDYSQPSLESLAKGIEKICKSIEHSTKRL